MTKAQIREAFNTQQFTQKIKAGAISVRLEGPASPPPPHLGFPDGTVSRRMRYIAGNGKLVAIVHEYVTPDGSLAASGKPDPKNLLMGNELWIVDPNDNSP